MARPTGTNWKWIIASKFNHRNNITFLLEYSMFDHGFRKVAGIQPVVYAAWIAEKSQFFIAPYNSLHVSFTKPVFEQLTVYVNPPLSLCLRQLMGCLSKAHIVLNELDQFSLHSVIWNTQFNQQSVRTRFDNLAYDLWIQSHESFRTWLILKNGVFCIELHERFLIAVKLTVP